MQVFFLELMNTIAIISQKGGAGKTTVALHLAVSSTRAGRNTAIIDLDPQASASWGDRREAALPVGTPPAPSARRRDPAVTQVQSCTHASVHTCSRAHLHISSVQDGKHSLLQACSRAGILS